MSGGVGSAEDSGPLHEAVWGGPRSFVGQSFKNVSSPVSATRLGDHSGVLIFDARKP